MEDLTKEALVTDLLGLAAKHQVTAGQRLVSARLGLGLTQAEVAGLVLVQARTADKKSIPRFLSRNAYCMYELDSVQPSLEVIENMSHALHVSPSWIAFGTHNTPSLKSKK